MFYVSAGDMAEENKLLIGIFFPVRQTCLNIWQKKYLNIVLIGDSFSPSLQTVYLWINVLNKDYGGEKGDLEAWTSSGSLIALIGILPLYTHI